MKKQLLLLGSTALIINVATAQVSDVSVIVSPTASYNFFDKKSTIGNGLMWGFQAGFGFGKYLELRGIYEQSLDMKQKYNYYEQEIKNAYPNFNFKNNSIKLNRMGGEFKGNIPLGKFSPYLILGTGVQTVSRNSLITDIDMQEFNVQSIYGSGGLGFKLNIGNRVTINLEGRSVIYNLNPSSLLYDASGTPDFYKFLDNQQSERMYNWSATAGVQFYLGGSNEGELSSLDKAYLSRFSSGMSGLKFTLAPGGAYVNFDRNSPMRSTYMLGGTIGFDLTDLIGFRGFYYHATTGTKPSFNFDKMSMYGGEFVGKLNVPRGIVPFITIGGGYINAADGYKGKPLVSNVGLDSIVYRPGQSGLFAKGGVGVTLPLMRNLEAFGSANLLYTIEDEDVNVVDIRSASQLRQHTMYSVGLRLNIGKNANTAVAYDKSLSPLRDEYKSRLATLEEELAIAYKNNDVNAITKIIEEKKAIENTRIDTDNPNLIRMTPAELERMIEKVINGVENEQKPNLEQRLDRLENLLLNYNQQIGNSSTYSTINSNSTVNDRLIAEIKKLNAEIQKQKTEIQALKYGTNNTTTTEVITPAPQATNTIVAPIPVPAEVHRGTIQSNDQVTGLILSKGLSAYIGSNFGQANTVNLGVRAYYGFTNTRIQFMPEVYFAAGEVNGFGISANGILPFNFNAIPNLEPYVGVGLGVHSINNMYSFTPNVIVGTAYQIGRGSIFADYTARGLFKNNQVALGYRFKF